MKIQTVFELNGYEKWDRNDPIPTIIKKQYHNKKKESSWRTFEKEVLNYLFLNKKVLGIQKVYSLKNSRIDGLLRLDNNKVILIEFKYALNWKNTCNARVEIQNYIEGNFHKKLKIEEAPPSRAIVFFHHFSGDWEQKRKIFENKNGWSNFYEEEKLLREKCPIVPVDIVQFEDNSLVTNPNK